MTDLTIGVIGVGFGSYVHVPAFRSDNRCRVKGIASLNADKAKKHADRWKLERAYESWQEMIEDEAIDAVTIAVPPAAQSQIIQEASQHKKHVFCEKPLAASLTQAVSAVKAVYSAKVTHGMDFIFPELLIWQQMKKLIDPEVIGSIRHFAYTWRVETYASRIKVDLWKNHPREGGGVLNNFGPHVLYNLEWLFGPINELGGIWRCSKNEIETHLDFKITFASGISGIVSLASDAFLGCGHMLEVFGNEGTVVLRNDTSDYALGFSLSMGTRKTKKLVRIESDPLIDRFDGRIKPVSKLASRFLDAVYCGEMMHPNITDGLRIQSLLEQLKTFPSDQPVKVKDILI